MGGGRSSIKQGAFTNGERVIQTLYLKGARIRYEAFI